MKLVFILAVSLIAVFMVDCRSHPGPDSQLPNIAEEHKRQQTQGPFITSKPELSEDHKRQQTQGPFITSEPEHTVEPKNMPGSDIEEEKELSENEFRDSSGVEDSVQAVQGMYDPAQMLKGNFSISSNVKSAFCSSSCNCPCGYPYCCSYGCCPYGYPVCCRKGWCCRS